MNLAPVSAAGRLAALDAARGVAIVLMIVFHLIWDLGNFGYIERGLPYSPGVQLFGHAIAIGFLSIVGVSLVLARAQGGGSGPFWWRIGRVAGAAALVSLATYLAFPQSFVFFGILHCIALSSLLAAPLLLLRWPAALAAAALAIVAPLFLSSAVFDAPVLTWIGLSTYQPPTNDYRPVLPWSGYVFAGVAAAQFWRERALAPLAAAWKRGALSFLGRHSLSIYLLHQPALFALFYALAALGAPPADTDTRAFVEACEERCRQSDVDAALCRSLCFCTAQQAASLTPGEAADPEKRANRLDEFARACYSGAMSP